jgi:hypothetical protein
MVPVAFRPHWLAALGVTAADLAAFGPDLRFDGRTLLAQHRDARGTPLGLERISVGPDGRLRYGYPARRPKGCVRSGGAAPAATPARLVLACGALPALCAAAFDGNRLDTIYLGAGGCWTAAVGETVGVVIEAGAGEVVLALADTPTGERSAEAAIMHLRRAHLPLRRLVRRRPAAGTWPETLRWIRSGEGRPGVAA